MEEQYQILKKEAGESILFFRLGDFYEMFGEDAEIASEILEIALTARNKKSDNPLPMCGVPVRSVERYVAKLTRAGKKVALAEQVSDPSASGIVKRKIVSIITPGTTLSEHVLEAEKSHYLSAFYADPDGEIALTFCDVSTGEAFVQIFKENDDACKELMKRNVAEVLMTPDHYKKYASGLKYFSGALSRHFLPENPERFVRSFFGVKTLKPFGIHNLQSAIHATALLFSFVEENQKQDLSHFSGIALKTEGKKLRIDADTIKNLELFAGSDGNRKNGLFFHLNHTKTPMGARELQKIMIEPFREKLEITSRTDAQSSLIENRSLHENISNQLSQVSDIERILVRISQGKSFPSDFVKLQNSLLAIKTMGEVLCEGDCPHWKERGEGISDILKQEKK